MLDKSGTWGSHSLEISEFTVQSVSQTASQILANTAIIRFYFRAAGDGNTACHTEVSIDNVTLSAE